MRLLLSATCLALLAAAPVSAPAQTAAPVSEAMVDRLIRALPHQEEFKIVPKFDEQQLARLQALNPGHDQDIRSILMAHATCMAHPTEEATMRALRAVARNLGAEKLGRLIAFYEGPDGQNFVRISDAADKGQKPTDAERKEMDRLLAVYPALDWGRGIQRAAPLIMGDKAFVQAITHCDSDQQAALSRAKLRSE